MNTQTMKAPITMRAPSVQGAAQPRLGAARALGGRPVVARQNVTCTKKVQPVCVRAQQKHESVMHRVGTGLAALGAAAALQFGTLADVAQAGEFDVISDSAPSSYVIDDAGVLSKASQKSIISTLKKLEADSGYTLDVVTIRKLVFTPDPFDFADQVIENWYPTVEEGNNVGVLLVATSTKEGALVGGPAFMGAVGDDLIDSLVSEQIPFLTEEEKYNEAVLSSIKRIEAKLTGKEDPGVVARNQTERKSNFKTKEETDAKRGKFAGVIIGLLVIATAVPMIQYYGYVGGK